MEIPSRDRETQDRNTLRAEALMALGEDLDDPTGLDAVRVRDFEAEHLFEDGARRPALHLNGRWQALGEAAGVAVARYTPTVALGPDAYLFATAEVENLVEPRGGGAHRAP